MPHEKKAAKSLSSNSASRKLKQPDYKTFKLHKRIKHPGPKLPSAWKLFKASVHHLWAHKRVYFGIAFIYLLLTVVLVRGLTFTADLGLTKDTVQELFTGFGGQLASSVTILSMLVESGSPAGATGSLFQSIILLFISLVMIWALRQTYAGQKITVKDAFYKSSYPLVQFLLVLLVIGLQMLPFIAGNFLYSATVSSGIAVTVLEKVLWGVLSFLLILLSIYLVSAYVFALYIVTLPDMQPVQALRSAKNLVQFRRWTVIRKVLFLPFIIIVIGAAIMLPVIMVAAPIAEIVFLILGAVLVMVGHCYMYSLYRELL